MLWPSTVELAEASIALADVLADVVIHHGRESVEEQSAASTCQLTFYSVDSVFTEAFEVGQSLRVMVADDGGAPFPRFTGRITDARLDVADLTVIAAGPWSVYRNFEVGAVAWPVESWSARVTRLFTEAGIPELLELHVEGALDPQLAARDPETAGVTTLGDYLDFLAPMVGALVADRPDGTIVVQAIGSRTLASSVALDPADVAYAPVWVAQLPGGNIVTVRYTGDQSEQVTVTDDASIALYGERPETIDTSFVNAADATARANTRLGRAAFSHWEVPGAPILRGLDLQLGEPVILEGLPDPAPFEPWTPVLEGWTDTITGPDWAMALALSDPLISGIALPWASVPPSAEFLWDSIDPLTDWTEALTLEALTAD